jgi:hypothetical protein
MSTFRLAALAAGLTAVFAAQAQLKPSGPSGQGLAPRAGAAAPAPAPANAPAPAAPVSKEAQDKQAAGKVAAQAWLVALDRRNWGGAWEASSNAFRSTVPLDKWMDAIPKVRADFGTLVDRVPGESQYKTTLEGRPAGDYVTVAFASKFEKKEVTELVTVVLEDGRWKVTGYSPR